MESNPYAPPQAAVQDEQPTTPVSSAPLFAVSTFKLAVMSVCTLGLYELYWFYKQWQAIRVQQRTDVTPAARAFFAVLFCYPCFSRIQELGVERGIRSSLPAGALAIGFIVCSVTWRLPDPYDWIAMLAFAFLLPVQAHVNEINAHVAPAHDRNDRFTGWNWLGIVVGGGLLLLAIVGSFLPQA